MPPNDSDSSASAEMLLKHQEGTCTRCVFYFKVDPSTGRRRCDKGNACEFCHVETCKKPQRLNGQRRLAKRRARISAMVGAGPLIVPRPAKMPTVFEKARWHEEVPL